MLPLPESAQIDRGGLGSGSGVFGALRAPEPVALIPTKGFTVVAVSAASYHLWVRLFSCDIEERARPFTWVRGKRLRHIGTPLQRVSWWAAFTSHGFVRVSPANKSAIDQLSSSNSRHCGEAALRLIEIY
jgi:hypothetical protein